MAFKKKPMFCTLQSDTDTRCKYCFLSAEEGTELGSLLAKMQDLSETITCPLGGEKKPAPTEKSESS